MQTCNGLYHQIPTPSGNFKRVWNPFLSNSSSDAVTFHWYALEWEYESLLESGNINHSSVTLRARTIFGTVCKTKYAA